MQGPRPRIFECGARRKIESPNSEGNKARRGNEKGECAKAHPLSLYKILTEKNTFVHVSPKKCKLEEKASHGKH